MSNVVDSKVVEMRFDNKNFEQNVQTSMSTLDKLKNKLKLTGASKGMENLSTAAKNVNLNPLGNAVETVQAKFSALQIIGITALQNITNSAINAGKHIVSALTIDPIKTGLSEYEQKMNAVQVIQANTRGKNNLDQITQALDDLNVYADKTIYNFAQMTSNIGKFTAQGLDVFQAADAVKGMANLAAASGASAEDMSRATYQMSQALSGSIKLMDWNSLRNANMATVELKNTLIDLAKVHGIAIDDMIAKEGTFEQTLSSGWLTGEMFTEAMNIYSGVYSDAELKAKGFTDAQIKNFNELAAMAESAATEVKTFTQLWDVLKETAQSGWAQTWELIFGDFEESKKMFTQLQIFFSGIIDGWSNARNTFLGGVMNISKPWSVIMGKLEGSGLGKIKETAEKISDLTHSLEEFQDIVHKVWMGDFGNSDTGRFEKLEAAGWDHRVVQDLVNKGIDYKLTIDDVEASHKKFGLTLSETNKETEKSIDIYTNLSDRKLRDAGLTEAEIKLYRQLEAESKRTGKSVSELVDEMSKVDGRTLLIDSFKNLGRALGSIFFSIKKAWNETFEPVSFIRIYSALATLKEKTRDIANFFTKNTDQMTRIFKGLFAIIDVVTTLVGGGFKIAFKAVNALLGMFDMNILDVLANVGDAAVAFRDWLDSVLDFTKIFEGMKDIFSKAAKGIKEWIETLKTSDNLPRDIINGIVNGLKFGLSVIGDAAKAIGDKIIEGIKSALEYFGIDTSFIDTFIEKVRLWFDSFKDADNIPSNIIQGIINGFKSGASAVFSAVIEFAKGIIEKVKGVLGIHSPSTVFFELALNCIAGFVEGVIEGAKKVFSAIRDLFTKSTEEASKNSSKIKTPFASIKEFGEKFINVVRTVFEKIRDFFKSVDPGTLLALGLIATTLFVTKKLADAIETLSAPLTGFSDMCGEIGETFKALRKRISGNTFDKIALGVRRIAEAIFILAVSVFMLASLDTGKLWSAVGAIVVLAGVLAALAFALSKMDSIKIGAKFDINTAILIVSLAGSLLLIAIALKKLSEIDTEKVKPMLTNLAIAIGALALVFAAAYMVSKNAKPGAIDNLGNLLFKMALAFLVVLIAIKLINKLTTDEIKKGLAVIAAIELLFAAVIAVSSLAGEHGKSAGSMLLKMSVAMLIMIGVVKLASKLSKSEVKKGLTVIAAIETLFVAIIAVSLLAGEHASKAGSMLLKMSIALLITVECVKIAGQMNEEDANRGLKVVGILEAIFGVLIGMSGLAGANAAKVGVMLIAMSFALLIIVGIMYLLTKFKPDDLQRSLGAISILEGLFAAIVGLSHYAKDVKAGTMWAMVGQIVALTAAVTILTFLDEDKLKLATGCLATLMGMLALLTFSMKSLKDVKLTQIGAIIVLLGLLTGAAYLLATCLDDVSVSIETAGSLVLLMAAMTGLVWVLGKINIDIGKAMEGAIALTSLALSLFAFAEVLKRLPDTKYCLNNVEMLLAVTAAMTLLLIPLTIIGTLFKYAIKGVLALTAMALPMFLFIEILQGMNGVQNALENVKALTLLMTAVTLMLIPLTIIGVFVSFALAGVVALTAVALPMLAFIGLIALMENLPNAISNIEALVGLMETLTKMLVVLAIVGPLAIIGVAALAALETLILATGAFAVAIGALFDKFPVLEKFLDTGIDILIKIAAGIGEMAAALISAFVNNLDLSNLVNIGDQLSAFADAISPFMTFAKDIAGWDTVGGVAILAATVIAFTGADFINGIAKLYGLTGNLVDVGKQLTAFGVAISPFMLMCANTPENALTGAAYICGLVLAFTVADFINGIAKLCGLTGNLVDVGKQLTAFGVAISPFFALIKNVDATDVQSVESIADLILVLTAADILNGITNLIDFFGAGSSFSDFGPELVAFGKYIKEFSDEVKDIDNASVDTASRAAAVLVSVANNIPSDCDWMDKLFGNNDMDNFGSQLTKLGEGLAGFSQAVAGNIDVDAVQTAKNAADLLTALAEDVPNQHDENTLWGMIVGDNSLDTFGEKCKSFAESMVTISDTLANANLDEAAIDTLATCGKYLTALAAEVPNMSEGSLGLSIQNQFGAISASGSSSNTLSSLGTHIEAFVSAMVSVNDSLKDVDIDEAAIVNLSKIGKLFAALSDAIPQNGSFNLEAVSTKLGSLSVNGTTSLSEFGTQIKSYAESMKGVAEILDGVEIDFSTITKLVMLGEGLVSIANAIPTDKIGDGRISLEDFAGNFKGFGKGVAELSNELEDVDISSVRNAATIGNILATTATKIADVDTSNFKKFDVAPLGKAISSYYENVKDIVPSKITASTSAINSLVTSINRMASLNTSGVGNFKSAIEELGNTNITKIQKTFKESTSSMVSSGVDIVKSVAQGMQNSQNTLNSVAGSIIGNMSKVFSKSTSSLIQAGATMVDKLSSGIKNKKTLIASTLTSIMASGVSKVRDKYTAMYNAGAYVMKGLANGISDNGYRAINKAQEIANKVTEIVEDAFGVASPSKVFYGIGTYLIAGLTNGLSDGEGSVYSTATNISETATKAFNNSMVRVLDALDGNMDMQPTIRPVVDTSDIEAGARTINGMLGMTPSVKTMANVGAINSMMNQRIQNGANDDVVSAIDKLRKNLGTINSNTYNINGITYDDGSNISSAVEELIRAARVERRV